MLGGAKAWSVSEVPGNVQLGYYAVLQGNSLTPASKVLRPWLFFEKVHQDLVIRGQTVDVKSLQQCFHACVKNDNSLRPGAGRSGTPPIAQCASPNFCEQLSQRLRESGATVQAAPLRWAIESAVCDGATATKMWNYIYWMVIQKGVERPLLMKGGRRFCLRVYVVACTRPAPNLEDRELEVYLSSNSIVRPNEAPMTEGTSTDPNMVVDCSSPSLYCRIDETDIPHPIWEERIIPQIKTIISRFFSCVTLSKAGHQMQTAAFRRFCNGWWRQLSTNTPVPGDMSPVPTRPDQGEVGIMGWDIMVDEDYRVWLIEINAVCNLQIRSGENSKGTRAGESSHIDTFNKQKLAEDLYSLLIGPIMDGDVPESGALERVKVTPL